MAPHLLSLPGEIRNRIYELVFAEENGVSYHEDLDGVGWLCVFDEKEDSDRLGISAKEDQDDAFDKELGQSTHYHDVEGDDEGDLVLEEFLANIEENVEGYLENYDHYVYDSEEDNEDDSNDSDGSGGSEDDSDVTEDEDHNVEGNSDIFGAIRNIIIDRRIKAKARTENIEANDDTTSEGNKHSNLEDNVEPKTELNDPANDDHPLQSTTGFDMTSNLVKVNRNGHTVLNQLQFVCRQLRKETKGLVLRDNTVVFSPWDDEEDASEQCMKFIKSLPKHYKKFLKTLAIIQEGRWEVPEIEPLVALCRLDPSIQVHFHDNRSSHHPAFMSTMAMECEIMMGRRGSLMKKLNHRGRINIKGGLFKEIKESVSKIENCPANFRMFPRRMAFDEAKFRMRAAKSVHIVDTVVPGVKGGLETLVACGRDFVENGW